MNDPSRQERESVLQDILSEKSLWAVYRKSRSIPFSKLNNAAGAVVGIATCMASTCSANVQQVADHLSALAGLAFNTSISLLGFLLAGFSFFATIADKSMFCQMAEIREEESGLSYLKYNFYAFMRVFFEYSVIAVVSFVLVVAFQENSGTRSILLRYLDLKLESDGTICILSCTLGLLAGSFTYLLFQLKSFIFNVFHVVMTTIRWALEEKYEKSESAADSDSSDPASRTSQDQ